MNKDTTMTVLVVEPGEAPYSKQMEHDLESLQKAVGGHIQCVYPFEDPIGIICDEEGKYKGYPLNRALRNEESEIYDVIAGTFLVVGLSSDNFASLSSELMEKYKAFFRYPELFFWHNEEIKVIKIKPKDHAKNKEGTPCLP